MPIVGYSTYQTPPSITEQCVSNALHIGYRSIDTAQCYGNEREVGLACRKSGIQREELFITTKLWGCHKYSDTLRSIDTSLRRLNLGYIDLLLIHEPTGDVHEIYRALIGDIHTNGVGGKGTNGITKAIYHFLQSCKHFVSEPTLA